MYKSKQHPLTKKELQIELKKWYKRIVTAFGRQIDSIHLDKKLDRITTKMDLTLEEFLDIWDIVKIQQERIKELEEKLKELYQFKKREN